MIHSLFFLLIGNQKLPDTRKSRAKIFGSMQKPCFQNEFPRNFWNSVKLKAVKSCWMVTTSHSFKWLVWNIPFTCHILDQFFWNRLWREQFEKYIPTCWQPLPKLTYFHIMSALTSIYHSTWILPRCGMKSMKVITSAGG